MLRTMIVSMTAGIVTLAGCSSKTAQPPVQAGQHPQTMTKSVSRDVTMNYLLYLPKDYGKVDKKWPLILFLHGAGERGSDLNQLKAHGPSKLAAQGKEFEFIIVSPQCPKDNWWPNMADDLVVLVDDVCQKYSVDTSRLYVTGLSMGGFGTWTLIAKYPNKFAAAAPICGGGDVTTARHNAGSLPIWVFHGAKDSVVPLSRSEDMVKAYQQGGNKNVKLTVYPEADHDSWTVTYNDPELYAWFLQHHK